MKYSYTRYAFGATLFSLFAWASIASAQSAAPTKLLVELAPQKSTSLALISLSVKNSVSFSEVQYLPLTDTHVLELPEGSDVEDVVDRLKQDARVLNVEKDEIISAHSQPNDKLFTLQWPLLEGKTNIGVEQAWNIINSSNLTLAIIDSGIDLAHEDIVQNLWKNLKEIPNNNIDDDNNGYIDDVSGYDFYNRDNNPIDDYGHGTNVSGVIGAVGNNGTGVTGINWNAKLMCLKVLDSTGNSTISKAVEAINYAINNGAKIINMSWGYTPNGAPSEVLRKAIQKAKGAGILMITSAGNGSVSGTTGENNDQSPEQANYPSSYSEDNIIAVAATDSSDNLASFSNYGPSSVDLGAPGVSILSTGLGNAYDYFSGTSASCPHVTGAIALVWALNPSLSYVQIKRLVLETTDSIPDLLGKTVSGGRLNIENALKASPAMGGNLLSSISPAPSTVSNNSSNSSADPSGGGGCSLSNKEVSMSGYYGFGVVLLGMIFFRKRHPL